jgi:hypothetical protein
MSSVINGDSNINLDFSTGGRITGDFSNATVASRAMFQTSTTNGNTLVEAIPNGTGTTGSFRANNTSDPTNGSVTLLSTSATAATIAASRYGSGAYLPMTFLTGGTESLRISPTSKAVILAGGSTSANGTGITFPATQSASSDANTLDDYEEGTFTASVIAGTSGSITLDGDNTLFYTKVGRTVTVSGRLDIQSVSSPTGELSVTLPFAAANAGQTASSSCSCFIWSAGGAATEAGLWVSWVDPNGAFAYFRYGNASTPGGNAAQYMQAGGEIRLNVTYVAA